MKIALAQINPTVGDLAGNVEKIYRFALQAKALQAKLVVFPELALCGYPPRDLLLRRDFLKKMWRFYEELKKEISGIAVILGLAIPNQHFDLPWQNLAVCFAEGKELARYAKNLLPAYDVYDEPRYFAPTFETTCFSLEGIRLALTVCEDIWNLPGFVPYRYPFDPISELKAQGPQVIINISASPFHLGKGELRKDLLRQQARRTGAWVVYCNQVGANDHLIFDGHSLVFNPDGKLLAEAKDFEEDLLVFDLKEEKPVLHPVSSRREESLLKALTLGLRDYFRKTGFSKALVGLSGGIDSSVTASIAARALGAQNVLGILMPSPYTSSASTEDALALAQNLGLETLTIPITQAFEALKKDLARALGKEPKGLTQENLQARLRGNILMALANEFGCLVLNTGNKSELAVGYCTLYGDTCGALSVLGDVLKGDVYALAREINREREIIPQRVLEKPPSAELRPDQKDEDDLPPYRLVDPIVRAFVEEGRSYQEIVELGYSPSVVKEVLRRLRREEYKRWQFPPTLRVSPQAFGYGWRYPIAQRFFFESASPKFPLVRKKDINS